jgi:leucyl aminopeptidase
VRIRPSDAPLARAEAEALAVVVASERVGLLRGEPAAGAGVLAELERRRFGGAAGASVLVRAAGRAGGRHLIVVGLGPEAEIGLDGFRRAAAQIIARARELRARSVAVALPAGPSAPDLAAAAGALVEGALLAAYAFTEYRRDADRVPLGTLVLAGLEAPRDPALRRALREAQALAAATNRARTWINLPAAVMTPRALAEEAAGLARAAGLELRVDGPRAIARLGMGALLGVARGSAEEPRFIRLVYRPGGARGRPAGAGRPRIALVGKGITFDSGGLSLKRPDGMEHMKRDMAGGAAVLAAMGAIAALGPDAEVRAYVPASENMPGGSALKPGDVLRTAAGKTVEVLNTDAEGRLVLADALAVAARDRPDAIVDLATLTGAIRTALGTRVAGVMGNAPALVRALVAAGERSGERLWELPLVRAYRDELDSTVADLRNVGAGRGGGSIVAGLFLEEFVARRPWAHLDLAAVAFTDKDLPGTPRGAVGFGVRLLARFVLDVSAPAVPPLHARVPT